MTTTRNEATIAADPALPIIEIVREFDAPPELVYRAHVDPELFARWCGPNGMTNTIEVWDARDGGSWRYVAERDGATFGFHGCFHQLKPAERIVQTFTWEGMPDEVSLGFADFIDLGDGRTRLRERSLCDSFEARDGWLHSGMEVGVNDGYGKLDAVLVELS
ncbi:SRPBCC family protein [Skermania piniformis]|uniref:SRPBCC family protein n=1 Tax=Skermania pinensis TaxID=39122 RepID=A0ABX8SBP9_9ACTN|nr:SRPBCC family protein [Skermania piniformis]QXQ15208.1 SRPBCC family protein [Skermania piniformis]